MRTRESCLVPEASRRYHAANHPRRGNPPRAGQHREGLADRVVLRLLPLNRILWVQYSNSIRDLQRGITDERVIEPFIKLAGGNLILLTIVTMAAPNVPDSGDKAIFIAEQILQAVPDRTRHDIVVTAALPRYLNEPAAG